MNFISLFMVVFSAALILGSVLSMSEEAGLVVIAVGSFIVFNEYVQRLFE